MKNSSDTTESDSAVSLIQQSHYNLFLNLKFARNIFKTLKLNNNMSAHESWVQLSSNHEKNSIKLYRTLSLNWKKPMKN